MKKIIFTIISFVHIQWVYGHVVQGDFRRTTPPAPLYYGYVVEPHLVKSTENILGPAVAVVQAVVVESLAFQRLSADNSSYDFIIHVTDRKTALEKDQENESIRKFTEGLKGDAFSIFVSDQPNSPVIVRVLWDEAMFEKTANEQLVERPDALARLVTLLGHEITGNVAHFLQRRAFYESLAFRTSAKLRAEEYTKSEVRAFQAGVKFLNDLIAKFDGQFEPKMIQDFRNALVREKQLLAHHESQLVIQPNVTALNLGRKAKSCDDVLDD